jgi:acetyl-CoA carboxylase beta subunit
VSTPQPNLRDALGAALALQPAGEPGGNVTVARGAFDGRPVRAALVENRTASGAIGVAEADKLGALFRVAARERSPLVLYLDSAGAKVSEGLAALGAFRHLFRAGQEAVLAGAPIAAVLGRNCFGGSSMLAHLARHRLFSPATRLGMSGPAVIAAASGLDPLDEMFRAMADAAMSPAARASSNPANAVWSPGSDLAPWLREALAPRADPLQELRAHHAALLARLASPLPALGWEDVRRKDLERLFPDGYEARESGGLLEGHGRRGETSETILGLMADIPVGAERAWRFADFAWRLEAPARLCVLLDCASHAPRLEEERLVLTEFIVDMSAALAAAARRGVQVRLVVTGKAGGGVYVALASPAAHVASVHGAEIQVLPGAAVAAILGASREALPSFDSYRTAGVADEELKLGLVP